MCENTEDLQDNLSKETSDNVPKRNGSKILKALKLFLVGFVIAALFFALSYFFYNLGAPGLLILFLLIIYLIGIIIKRKGFTWELNDLKKCGKRKFLILDSLTLRNLQWKHPGIIPVIVDTIAIIVLCFFKQFFIKFIGSVLLKLDTKKICTEINEDLKKDLYFIKKVKAKVPIDRFKESPTNALIQHIKHLSDENFTDFKISRYATSLSFRTLFTMLPLLIFSVGILFAISGYMQEKSDKKETISYVIEMIIPTIDETDTNIDEEPKALNNLKPWLTETLANKESKEQSLAVSIFSAILLLFFLFRFFGELEITICEIHNSRKKETLWESLKNYLAILISIIFLLAIIISILSRLDNSHDLYSLFFAIVMFGFGFVVLYMIYKVLPNKKLKMKYVIIPAIFASLALASLQFLIRNLIGSLMNFDIFGPFIIIPVLMFWLYIVWSIIIWGVKFSQILHKYDTNRPEKNRSIENSSEEYRVLLFRSIGKYIFNLLSDEKKEFPFEYPMFSNDDILTIQSNDILPKLLAYLEKAGFLEFIRTDFDGDKNKHNKNIFKYRLKNNNQNDFYSACANFTEKTVVEL